MNPTDVIYASGVADGLGSGSNYFTQIFNYSFDVIDIVSDFILNPIFYSFCLILLVFIFIGVYKK